MLTTLIVLTVTAILVVGFVLMWDVFLKDKLDELVNTDFYATEKPLYLSDVTVDISSSGLAQLPKGERKLIEEYFTCYYASLGGFYHEDMKKFYDFQCIDEFYDELALDFELKAGKNADADYSFKSCSVYIYVTDRCTTNEGTAILNLRISSEIPCSFSPVPIKTSEENHTFTVTLEDEPLICAHDTDRLSRTFSELVFEEAIAADGYTPKDLSYTYFYPYQKTSLNMLDSCYASFEEWIKTSAMDKSSVFTSEYAYDREAAAYYGMHSEGHSEDFGSYDINDANFCSQCLIIGGIPMDTQGNRLTQWKWYGYEENNGRTREGCTKTWYDPNLFWTYATENSGFGLVAEKSEQAETGDIIQLIKTSEEDGKQTVAVFRQCIITAPVTDSDGNICDYLVCTDKIKNMPLSLLWNGEIRILSVIGYNTANI